MVKKLAIVVMVLAVAAIVIGGVFVGEGFAKNKLIVDRMNVEKVTLADKFAATRGKASCDCAGTGLSWTGFNHRMGQCQTLAD